MKRSWVALALVAVAFAGGCDNGEDTSGETAPSPRLDRSAPETVYSGDCANSQEALSREASGNLEGDVVGDGDDDVVSLVKDPDGNEGCRAFLVVETADTSYVTPVEQEGMTFDLGFPALRGLVELDGRPGFEIVAGLLAGASTEFFGAWTFTERGPARIRLPGDTGDLFPSGGSVGHVDASDCATEGIVVSSGLPRGDGYSVERTFYRFEGARAVQRRTQRVRIPGGSDFDRFPEFIGTPFGSCSHP